MMIALHNKPRTTPTIHAEIASSTASAASASSLAQRFGITELTVHKWKKCSSFSPGVPHTATRLRTTSMPARERVSVELRRTPLPPLDELSAVTQLYQTRSSPGSRPALPWHGQPQRVYLVTSR